MRTVKRSLHNIAYAALFLLFLFCGAALSAQVVTLNQSVTTLSVNADDTILAASDADSLSVYETASYSRISAIKEKAVNSSLFYRFQNSELLVTIADTEKFLLYMRSANGEKAYTQAEAYTLTDYTEGKTIGCAAFSNNTNYIAAACTDFSIQLHFKLRFTQEMITRTLDGHHAEIYGLAFSDDAKYLVSVSKNGEALLWDCATYTQAARLDTVYTDSNIPAVFTADSLHIISMESETSVQVSDITGKKLVSIDTGSVIRALAVLSDPDKIAVVNDKNEILIYSIQLQKSMDTIRLPKSEKTNITAVTFCHTENAAFVGCASGAVYKLHPENFGIAEPDVQQNILPETSGVQTEESAEAAKPFKPSLKTERSRFFTISAFMGFLLPEKTHYRFLFGADMGYRSTYLTAPVYVGVGLRAYLGLPKTDFPAHYEDFSGNAIKSPLLWMGEVYAPVGIEVVLDRRGYAVLFEEVAATVRFSMLNRPKTASSKAFFSYGGRFTTGITVKFFTFAAAINYDSLWNLFPEIILGGRINLTKNTKTKRATL